MEIVKIINLTKEEAKTLNDVFNIRCDEEIELGCTNCPFYDNDNSICDLVTIKGIIQNVFRRIKKKGAKFK